jgi:hypothetical protein
MAKKKKKKNNPGPRWKRMKQPARLAHAKAKNWVGTYNGKNLITGYAKWFDVDLLCALLELRMLGVQISAEREKEIRQTLEGRKRKKKRAQEREDVFDAEAYFGFAYIAGYTSGGMPYGLTHEENAVLNGEAEPEPWVRSVDDIPF